MQNPTMQGGVRSATLTQLTEEASDEATPTD